VGKASRAARIKRLHAINQRDSQVSAHNLLKINNLRLTEALPARPPFSLWNTSAILNMGRKMPDNSAKVCDA
jgi:hypothetical protein